MEKHIKGLSHEEVLRSREKYGENIITPVKKESLWKLLFEKFNDPIIKILFVAAALSLVVAFFDGEFAETIGIFCAILLATGVSFWFEYDAKKRFEILNTVNDDVPVKVIRDAQIMEVPKRYVVVGDIVVLGSGDEIPADGQLIEAVSLKVNESSLTGEQLIGKSTDPKDFSKDATYPSDMVYRGTTVAEGHGMFRVVNIGDATEYGKVAEQATIESDQDTPLNKQLKKLSKIIGRWGGALAVLIFLVLLVKGFFFGGDLLQADALHITGEILNYFMVSVAIMVMAVPEGLPMSITLSLAMSMRRMLKTNNLVRKMHACETMGAVTVICTDKTGTLTRNEMRVADMILYAEMPDGQMQEMIAVNSTAFLDVDHKVIGNPTEGALLLWMYGKGEDYEAIRECVDVIDQLTFTTERKYMATLATSQITGKKTLYVKGAPEIVRAMCAHDGLEKQVVSQLREYQGKAMRTLGFAVKETTAKTCKEAIKQGELRFVAVAAISDPVRDDVPAAVHQCLNAGIMVKIVTGDTPATAREIARQIGLWGDSDGEENHMTGIEFEAMSDAELLDRVENLKIMSRARPLDKQRLVRLLQKKGEVVAVTGDGTNDAPALNFAQVGLSMGSGTSVAKEASDITLLDDSFKSIATAVMWGRSLYKNIQRFVMFQLTVNFSALVVVFFGSMFGSGKLPLTVTQILWVNLIMDTFAAIALAALPPNPKVMEERPRRETDFIIDNSMYGWITAVGTIMVAVLMTMVVGWGESITPYQLSVFFTVFVMMQVWNLFNAREFGSRNATSLWKAKSFLGIVLIILVGQIIIVTFGGEVFRTVPISLLHWIIIIGSTATIALGGSIVRFFQRRGTTIG